MAIQGDQSFERLYRKYRSAVISYIKRFGFDHDRASDLAQETFLRVYRNMGSWRHESEWSYIRTTASRIALNVLREGTAAKRSASLVALEDEALREIPLEEASVEAALIQSEDKGSRQLALRRALASLPPRLRTPLLLRLSGRSYQSIAGELSLSLDAVKSRLHEAKIRLREQRGSAPELNPDVD